MATASGLAYTIIGQSEPVRIMISEDETWFYRPIRIVGLDLL